MHQFLCPLWALDGLIRGKCFFYCSPAPGSKCAVIVSSSTVKEPARCNAFGGSSGLGHFPGAFGVVVCGPGVTILLPEIFFFLFSFVLLPKFAIAELPTLDKKHAFCSYLRLFQGKPLPGVTIALLVPVLSPFLLGCLSQDRAERVVWQASTFVTAKLSSSVGSHFPFPVLILCPFKPELLLLLICIEWSLSNHHTLNGISTCF